MSTTWQILFVERYSSEKRNHHVPYLQQQQHGLTWKKAGLVFRAKLTVQKDKIYTAWCHDTFTKVLKSFSPSVSLLKNNDNYSNCIIYKNPILLIGHIHTSITVHSVGKTKLRIKKKISNDLICRLNRNRKK